MIPRSDEELKKKTEKIIYKYAQAKRMGKPNALYDLVYNALRAERVRTLGSEEVKNLADAARGLRYGEDWNSGTQVRLYGYREKLIRASYEFDAALSLAKEGK